MVLPSEEKKLKISGLFLVCLSLFPILRPAYQSILIICFSFVSILFYHNNFLNRVSNKKVRITFILLTGYYIWHIFSSLWSEQIIDSLVDAQSSVILLLFPIVFIFFHPPINKLIVKRVQLVFVFAMLVYLFLWYQSYLVGISYYQTLSLEELPVKDYSFFEQIEHFIEKGFYLISGNSIRGYRLANEEVKLFTHHNYVASYFVLAFYGVLNLIFSIEKLLWRFLLLIPMFLFLGIIFYLPSKMNQLVLLAGLPVFAYYFFGKKIALMFIFIGIVGSCFAFYKNREKLAAVKFIEKENLLSKDASIIDFYRYHVYNCITDKLPENFWLGMGKGDVQPFLNSCLPNDEWPGLSKEKREYNTHSQPLSYLISGGIIGLVLFILLWMKLLALALTQKRAMLMIVLLVIFANTIFENYLTRAWGSFLFVFFTFIYLQNDVIGLTVKQDNKN